MRQTSHGARDPSAGPQEEIEIEGQILIPPVGHGTNGGKWQGRLAREHPGSSYLSSDRFHLNDLGYRCMAEYAARAIVAGVLQADIENGAMH